MPESKIWISKKANIINLKGVKANNLQQSESLAQVEAELSLNAKDLKANATILKEASTQTQVALNTARAAYKAKYAAVDSLVSSSNGVIKSVKDALTTPLPKKPQKGEMAQILEALKNKGVLADKTSKEDSGANNTKKS